MAPAGLVRTGLAALVVAGLAGGPALSQNPPPAPEGAREKFRWPLRGAIVHKFKAGESDGIDIAAPIGEPVHAAADGICVHAGDDIQTYGKLVLIRHPDGYVTVYADNSELDIREGDAVRRGQIIAKSGVSGNVPHLHFELRKDGKPIDPIGFLVPL